MYLLTSYNGIPIDEEMFNSWGQIRDRKCKKLNFSQDLQNLKLLLHP